MLFCLVYFVFTFSFVNSRRILKQSLEYYPNFNHSSSFQEDRRRLSDSESHRVNTLPGLTESITQYAGFIQVDQKRNGNLFYWLFEEPNKPLEAPLMIWLNGGPGCSSMDGLFLELGPLRLDGDSVRINPHSWHNAANILFLDQPVGTGLSFTNNGYAKSDEEINLHFTRFLINFLELHPRYLSTTAGRMTSRQIFLVGESHAGHYISNLANHLIKRNQALFPDSNNSNKNNNNNIDSSIYIDLGGLALGNPWIDPYNQYDVSEFAHGLGLITIGQKFKLKEQEKQCQSLLTRKQFNQKTCFSLLDDVVDATAVDGSHKVLMYDTRKFVPSTSVFPPGHEAVERYLNRADVRRAIHADNSQQKYVECADPPFFALSHQDGKGATAELANVLDSNVPVLIYSGQYDLICNHLGTEKALYRLDWSGREGWRAAQPGVWVLDGKPVGYLQKYNNLQSLVVLDSGHMVPMDLPATSLEMIRRFISTTSLSSGLAKLSVLASPPAALASSYDYQRKASLRTDPSLDSSSSSSSSSTSSAFSFLFGSNQNLIDHKPRKRMVVMNRKKLVQQQLRSLHTQDSPPQSQSLSE